MTDETIRVYGDDPVLNWPGAFTTLSLTGASGCYARCLDHAALDITGDIDIRAWAALPDWTPATNGNFAAKHTAITPSSGGYNFYLGTDGKLHLQWSNGTTNFDRAATVATAIPDGGWQWVRVTLDVDDGAGNHVVKFWKSGTGSSWSQIGTTVTTAGTTSIAANTTNIHTGANVFGTGGLLTGQVHGIQVRNGIGGTLAADIDFTGLTPGSTSFTDNVGRSWSTQGAASIATLFPAAGFDTAINSLGQSLGAVDVRDWAPAIGTGLYMGTTVGPQVLMGSMSLENSQAEPTGTDCTLSIFKPSWTLSTFQRVSVPTSQGYTSVVGTNGLTGGADISDVIEIDLGDNVTRVAAISAWDYHGWNIATYGRFPSWIVFERNDSDETWHYDATRSRTIDQLWTDADVSWRDDIFDTLTNGFAEQYHQNPGMNEMAVCPVSGHVLIACYFPTNAVAGARSGSIIAIDPATSDVVAYFRFPNYVDPDTSHNITWAPREIQTDPSGTSVTRAIVIPDVFDATDGSFPGHTAAEIQYDPTPPTITQVSDPFLPLQQTDPSSVVEDVDFNTARWSKSGVLYIGTHWRTYTGLSGLSSKSLHVYRPGLTLPTVGTGYGTRPQPSYTVASMEMAGGTSFWTDVLPDGTVVSVGAYGGRIASWTPDVPDADRPSLANNPTFVSNVDGWAARYVTATVTWDSGDGGRLKATGNAAAGTMSVGELPYHGVSVDQVGQSLVCTATVRAGTPTSGVNARVGVDYLDATGNIIAADYGNWKATTSGATTSLYADSTIPFGAYSMRLLVIWNRNQNGDIHYILDNNWRFAPGDQRSEVRLETSLYIPKTDQSSNTRPGGVLRDSLAVVVQPFSNYTNPAYPSAPYALDSFVATVPFSLLGLSSGPFSPDDSPRPPLASSPFDRVPGPPYQPGRTMPPAFTETPYRPGGSP